MIGRLAALALPVAIAAIVVAVLAVLGARLRLVPPLAALGLFSFALLGGGGIAFVLGVIGVVRGAGPEAATRMPAILAGALGLGCVVFVVVLIAGAGRAPVIHDISTDLDDPPAFSAAARIPANAGRDLSYPHGNDETPRLQRAAYPDLNPIALELPADEAFEASLEAAEMLGWEVSERADGAMTFEAQDDTSVFRFVDDVVVRVRPAGSGAVVDVRSTSRVGRGDMGVNAERIRRFRDLLLTGRQ